MEARVTALEMKFDKIDGKLDRLLDAMSSFKLDMVRLDGRVSTLDVKVSMLDTKVDALDTKVDALDAKVGSLDVRVGVLSSEIAEVKGRVSALPNAEVFGHLRGRVDSLPTTATFAGMFGIAVAVITIANNWQTVLAFFR